MKNVVAVAVVSALGFFSNAYAHDDASNKNGHIPCPMMSASANGMTHMDKGHDSSGRHPDVNKSAAARNTSTGRIQGVPRIEEDAAILSQFGYPGADSGPYGGDFELRSEGTQSNSVAAITGRTGGAPRSDLEDAAIRAQFGYPGGDSGPYGGDFELSDGHWGGKAGATSGRTGASTTRSDLDDPAIRAQFGYPGGDSGPYGGDFELKDASNAK